MAVFIDTESESFLNDYAKSTLGKRLKKFAEEQSEFCELELENLFEPEYEVLNKDKALASFCACTFHEIGCRAVFEGMTLYTPEDALVIFAVRQVSSLTLHVTCVI